MAYHLHVDGLDDTFIINSVTFDRVEIDAVIQSPTVPSGTLYLFDSMPRNSFIRFAKLGGSWNPNSNMSPAGLMFDERTLVTAQATQYSGQVRLFSNFACNVYSIKFYNGATLEAHYDLTTGDAKDKSGKGNHAVLTGGTWVQDGGGPPPTGTTLTLSLADSVSISETVKKTTSKRLSDSFAIAETVSKRTTKSVNDSINLTDNISKQPRIIKLDTFMMGDWVKKTTNKKLADTVTLSDSINKKLTVTVIDTVNLSENTTANQGGRGVTLTDSIIVTDAIVKKVICQLKIDAFNTSDVEQERISNSLVDNITLSDSITKSSGKSIILSDSITLTDALSKAVNVLKKESINLTDISSKIAKVSVYDVVVQSDDLKTNNSNAPTIIGTIKLKGNITLNVYLVGKRELKINLQGQRVLDVNLKGSIQ